jgi:nicotinamidase-related amidase
LTTLNDRPNQALLVVDAQNDVVSEAQSRDEVMSNIGRLVEQAREAGVHVVWVQHSDDELIVDSVGWKIVPELHVVDGEPIVRKMYGDAFEDTNLSEVLAEFEVGHVVIAGAQSDACIRSTLHGAFVRGYDTTLVSDAHTTEDLTQWGAPSPDMVIAHTNLYWSFQTAPGRVATVVETSRVEFARS